MITKKLNILFIASLLLIYLHGVEEIITGFQHYDSFMVTGARIFQTSTEIFYWVSHILWWLLLPTLFVLFRNTRVGLYLLVLYGFVFLVELHHPIKALLAQSYYPGMITALFYPIFGFVYWRELFKNIKGDKRYAR